MSSSWTKKDRAERGCFCRDPKHGSPISQALSGKGNRFSTKLWQGGKDPRRLTLVRDVWASAEEIAHRVINAATAIVGVHRKKCLIVRSLLRNPLNRTTKRGAAGLADSLAGYH